MQTFFTGGFPAMSVHSDCFPWSAPDVPDAAPEFFRENSAAAGQSVDDALLTAAASRGDGEAFRLLVEKHGPALQAFCLRVLACPEEARDVAQEAFVRIWCRLRDGEARYEDRGRFRAWLWRVALNLCRDRLRSNTARRRRLAVWESEEAGRETVRECPAELAARRADLRRLARGLEMLPEKLRLPLMLCSIENLSYAECAEVLEISPRAVEGRVRRARERLLEWWNREER